MSKTYDGEAQYFREAIRDYLEPWCEENNIDLYSDGLKIYTTIDTRMQNYAEQAVMKQMKTIQRDLTSIGEVKHHGAMSMAMR